MKIMCVVGGSYKSFYLNYFTKIKNCDLIILNFGIMYDCSRQIKNFEIVSKELNNIASEANTVVVAVVNMFHQGCIQKCLVCSNGKRLVVASLKTGIKICFSNLSVDDFIVGNQATNYKSLNKIVFCEQKLKPNIAHCSKTKKYIFISEHEIALVTDKTLKFFNNKVSVFKI